MVTYLDAIALGHLNPIIRENAFDGVFFLKCAQDNPGALQRSGMSPLQLMKIMLYMPTT